MFLNIQNSTTSVESFLKTTPVHCQRLEEPRVKPLIKILSEKLLPTHLEVSVIIPRFSDDYYQSGKPYSIDANTRKVIWSKYDELRPLQNLYVTTYYAESREEIEQIYRSIDSSNSVETKKQILGGLCRSNGFLPESKKVKTGQFVTALRRAYTCSTGLNSKLEDTHYYDLSNKTEFNNFIDQIKALDKYISSFQKDTFKSKKFATGPIMAAFLILGKKYGIDNPKFIEMFDSLVNEKVNTHQGVGGLNDGVSVVWMDLYQKHNPIGQWTLSSEGYGPVIIGNILYCLDSYMSDTLLNIRNHQSTKGIVQKDQMAISYFKNYHTM
jgi:hypothetical protein